MVKGGVVTHATVHAPGSPHGVITILVQQSFFSLKIS
ncbi:MAG: hypothetical protein JWL60_1649 [Gemmatimonadetes bacterium]|jgi:hypothetical protein|nr:hypothetical protein [Gemmatimonadota bacterium]